MDRRQQYELLLSHHFPRTRNARWQSCSARYWVGNVVLLHLFSKLFAKHLWNRQDHHDSPCSFSWHGAVRAKGSSCLGWSWTSSPVRSTTTLEIHVLTFRDSVCSTSPDIVTFDKTILKSTVHLMLPSL